MKNDILQRNLQEFLDLGELLIDLRKVSALSKTRKWSAEKLYYYDHHVFIDSAKLKIEPEDYVIIYELLTEGR